MVGDRTLKMSTGAVRRLRIVVGKPWKEAVICAVRPETPLWPWHRAGQVEVGDVVVVVIDTEPRAILCWFTQDSLLSLRDSIWMSAYGGRLCTVIEVEEFAVGCLLTDPDDRLLDSPATDILICALAKAAYEHGADEEAMLIGHSSLAEAQILLDSELRCSDCDEHVDLLVDAAEDQYVINTVSKADFLAGLDWPDLLCRKCYEDGHPAAAEVASLTNSSDTYGFQVHRTGPNDSADTSPSAIGRDQVIDILSNFGSYPGLGYEAMTNKELCRELSWSISWGFDAPAFLAQQECLEIRSDVCGPDRCNDTLQCRWAWRAEQKSRERPTTDTTME